MTPQKPRPAAPTLRHTQAAGNKSDLDVHEQLLGELAAGDSLPDFPLPDDPLPDDPLPDDSLPEARLHGSVGD